jgi:hypothetical protein
MGTASGGTLAKAVTEAGGLGIIGFGYGNQERIDQEFRAAGNARVGCGFVTWSLARQPHLLALGPRSRARSRHGLLRRCPTFCRGDQKRGRSADLRIKALTLQPPQICGIQQPSGIRSFPLTDSEISGGTDPVSEKNQQEVGVSGRTLKTEPSLPILSSQCPV